METDQLAFLLYLLLGQAVLIVVWSVFRRRVPNEVGASTGPPVPNRLHQIGFAFYLLLGQVALFAGWMQLVALWEATGAVARADLVITLHFGFVLFVLTLQFLILVGLPFGWVWTRNFWLRLLHLVCIEIVVGQAVVALECPLTSLERDLRASVRPDEPGDDELSEGDLNRAKLHYLEGASPAARFFHDSLFLRNTLAVSIPQRIYHYIVAPLGLLLLLTWVFVPPRIPGQREC